jgi:arabinan endo-1,5-alpha-L-arabinosidase
MTTVRLAPLLTVAAAAFVMTVAMTPAAVAAPATGTSETATAGDSWRLRGDLAAHDPALIRGDGDEDWYVFSTGAPEKGGGTIQIRSSDNGKLWEYAGTIWDTMPAWLTEAVPGANNMWAPEITEHDGVYYLYYAVSTWGKNNSVIALATNTTLDPTDPAYQWVDRGRVVSSVPDSDFNAIDPGIIEDADGTPWMAFGSYWSGIRMVQLRWPDGMRADDATPLHLADRKVAPNAVEAPYIVANDGHYYLFTSWGQCCQGVDSDYQITVGRSENVTGPYVDRDGRALLEGGGTVVQSTSGDRVGPGGQSVSEEILAYHYYDATAEGAPRLGLQRLSWDDDGWPELRSEDED